MPFTAPANQRPRHVLDRNRSKKRHGGTNDETLASTIDVGDSESETEEVVTIAKKSNALKDGNEDDEVEIVESLENMKPTPNSIGQPRRSRRSKNIPETEYDTPALDEDGAARPLTHYATAQLKEPKLLKVTRGRLRKKARLDDSSEEEDIIGPAMGRRSSANGQHLEDINAKMKVLEHQKHEVKGEQKKAAATSKTAKGHFDANNPLADEVRPTSSSSQTGLQKATRAKGRTRRNVVEDISDLEDGNSESLETDKVRRSNRQTVKLDGMPKADHKRLDIEHESDDSSDDRELLKHRKATNTAKKRATIASSKAKQRSRKYNAGSTETKPVRKMEEKKRRRAIKDISDSEAEDSMESEHAEGKKHGKSPASTRNVSRQKSDQRKSRKSSDDDSSYDDGDKSESSFDESDDAPDSDDSLPLQEARSSKNRKQKKSRSHLAKENDDDEQDVSTDLESKKPLQSRGKRQSKIKSRKQSSRRSTPTRKSVARVRSNLADPSDSDQNIELTHKKRRKSVSDDDDEFVDDQEEEESDELELDFIETESSKQDDEPEADFIDSENSESEVEVRNAIPQPKSPHRKIRAQKVDDIEGTIESSSDDDIFDKAPQFEKKDSKRSESPAASDDDDEEIHDKPQWSRSVCPSEVDAITLDYLPSKHVCCIAPDGQSRQCFALETLRKVALTSALVTFRDDFDGKQNFLQPPHFRTSMSDDLLDQIASRFGREALDIHGEFYTRSSERQTQHDESDSDDGYVVHYSEALMDDEAFVHNFRRYISRNMGSQDIYACPLCYTEAHRLLRGVDQDEDRANDSPSFLNFVHDPMMILGFLDNDRFSMASTFCFVKVADAKRHLREDHDVDTQKVDGNELYSRFKVRGQNGLLQTYINRIHFRSRQGDMMRYWLEGNNQSFLLLLSQMKVRETYWQIMSQDEDDAGAGDGDAFYTRALRDKATKLWDEAKSFFESFTGRNKKIWDTLSAPFCKVTREEVEEFIASENSSEEDEKEEVDHSAYHRMLMEKEENELEEKLIEHLREKRRAYGSDDDEEELDDEDDDDDEAEMDDDGGSHVLVNSDSDEEPDDGGSHVLANSDSDEDPALLKGHYSEVSEEDEWEQRKRPTPRKGIKDRSLIVTNTPTNNSIVRKRLGKGRASASNSAVTPQDESRVAFASSTSAAKAKRVIKDSDDEDELVIVVGETPNLSNPTLAGKAKRILFVESDEETM